MRLNEAFNRYRQDVVVFRNLSPKTEHNNLYAERSFCRVLGNIDCLDLNLDLVRKWRHEVSKTCSNNTIREYLLQLRVTLRHLESIKVPAMDWKLIPVAKRDVQPIRVITPEDVNTLLEACDKNRNSVNKARNKLIVSLLFSSGIRVSELCSLDRDSIYERQFTVIGKGRKPRLCVTDKRTEELLAEYLKLRNDSNHALLVSFTNCKRMDAKAVQEVFRHVRKRAGLENVHPHTMRHTLATDLMRNGMHIYTLSRILGHSSIATTQQYLHLADKQLLEEYDRYHKDS